MWYINIINLILFGNMMYIYYCFYETYLLTKLSWVYFFELKLNLFILEVFRGRKIKENPRVTSENFNVKV